MFNNSFHSLGITEVVKSSRIQCVEHRDQMEETENMHRILVFTLPDSSNLEKWEEMRLDFE
jgi:hypothetical protein